MGEESSFKSKFKIKLPSSGYQFTDSIGFEWDLNDWKKMFEELGAFATKYGH